MRTRVKICGITRLEDAMVAAEAGVDSIGLVFYHKSPRNLSPEAAAGIARALPPFVTVTALFLNPGTELVRSVLDSVPVDLLQFHGTESESECTTYNLPYIKAIGMRDRIDLSSLPLEYPSAKGFLLDSHSHGEAGGTGESFDWSSVSESVGKPLILAGGLNPSNVRQAIEQVRPWAVDLSSGVEVRPGIKDHKKIYALINEVKGIDGC